MIAGRLAAGIAFVLLTVPGTGAFASPTSDRWAVESGEASASATLESCLAKGPNDACLRVAYTTCEAEHGTMAQRNLNDCAAYSKRAWEARMRVALASLEALAQRPGVQSASGRDAADRLRTSQQLWLDWSEMDCEIRSAWARGGSLHTLELLMCGADLAASRALDLERLTETWSR